MAEPLKAQTIMTGKWYHRRSWKTTKVNKSFDFLTLSRNESWHWEVCLRLNLTVRMFWERHNFAVWRSSSFYLTCVGFGSRHHQYTHCRPKSGHKVKQELDKWPTSIKTSTFLRKQLPFCYFYAWWQQKRCICIKVYKENSKWKKTKGWQPVKVNYCLSRKWEKNPPTVMDNIW